MKKINTEIILVILLVLSLWMNIKIPSKIERIENKLGILKNDIHNINSNVNHTLEELRKEGLWVRESKCEITDFSDNLEMADIKITFTLNEIQKDEKVYVAAISEKNNKVVKFEIPESESLTFMLDNITLPASDTYDLQVIGEKPASFRSGKLETIFLSEYKKGFVIINGGILGAQYSIEKEEGNFSFFTTVDVMKKSDGAYMDFLKNLEVMAVNADIYIDDQYLDTMDLLNEKNYVPVELRDLSHSIPESESPQSRGRAETEHYLFSGKYEFKEELNMDDIKLVITVKDNKGNIYKEPINR